MRENVAFSTVRIIDNYTERAIHLSTLHRETVIATSDTVGSGCFCDAFSWQLSRSRSLTTRTHRLFRKVKTQLNCRGHDLLML